LYDYAQYIYLAEPEIKDITDIAIPTSYIDLHIATDGKGWLRTKKRDDYNFPLWTFHLYVAIPGTPVYGENIYIYISQLIRYSKA